MKVNELDKLAFEKDIKKLVEARENTNLECDCYCALMKQLFLSKSTLN